MGKKHLQPIEIVNSILNRYETTMPQIFKKLNDYEKTILENNPRHIFSLDDCINVIKQYNNYTKLSIDINSVAMCTLSLYNWYKSKIIYLFDNTEYNNTEKMDRKLYDFFPYSCIYIDIRFDKLDYIGCFVTITKEKEDHSLRKYLVIAFVEYDYKKGIYTLEPYVLAIRDNISIEKAFMIGLKSDMLLPEYIDGNIFCSKIVISILYFIIDSINFKSKKNHTPTVKRNVHETKISIQNNSQYYISYSTKYVYENKQSDNIGTSKRPHARRSFERTLKIFDDNGNIIGYKKVPVTSTYVHKDKEITTPTIKKI